MVDHLEQLYQERLERFRQEAIELGKKYDRFSAVRLIIFLVALAIALLLYPINVWLMLGFIVLFLVGFARFVLWHQSVLHNKKYHEALCEVNEQELSCLNGTYHTLNNGEAYVDPQHPYTVDLDFFGDYSLFQYFNRTTTLIGEKVFAKWMQQPASKAVILDRQTTGKELGELLDWRQSFQATGILAEDGERDSTLLLKWLEDEPLLLHNQFIRIAKIVFPLLLVATIVLWLMQIIPYQVCILMAIVNGGLVFRYAERINETLNRTSIAEKVLTSYADLIGLIEQQDFETPYAKNLKSKLEQKEVLTSTSLRSLSKIIGQLNVRFNAFSIVLQILMLWDLQWLTRLEKWKETHKANLPKWMEALEEMDAMISYGAMYHNHKDWSTPKIVEHTGLIGEGIGHPLLDARKRITNHITFPNNGHIKLVTGSNMAGKSTFLRSVGVNIILAMVGAPTCAKRFEVPLLTLYTSMRTQDALHESTSSFYAELKRLKTVIEAVEEDDNVFFLLDEILKGTNSNDRHTGSKALIEQLIQSKGMGIIATHDLELGEMEASAQGTIENLCMEVEVEKDRLVFDYTIKKGVSKSFNATYLMRNMGIKV